MAKGKGLEWKLFSLELDNPGRAIGRFFKNEGYDISRKRPMTGSTIFDKLAIPKLELREVVSKHIKLAEGERALVVYGSGEYHHFTYGLCMLANRISDDFCYIHIDHHHDWWDHYNDSIDCGNFVRAIFEDTNVKKDVRNVLLIGSNPTTYGQG